MDKEEWWDIDRADDLRVIKLIRNAPTEEVARHYLDHFRSFWMEFNHSINHNAPVPNWSPVAEPPTQLNPDLSDLLGPEPVTITDTIDHDGKI